MQTNVDVVIVGGGLAGLTAAIQLSKANKSVLIIEKNSFPKHKVCGEYISNEVLPYLQGLGLDIPSLQPTAISKLEFSIASGATIHQALPLGGFGISRYALDYYLYQKALANGCQMVQDNATNIQFDQDQFTIFTANTVAITAKVVLGAFGKRSNLDVKLNRDFILKNSPWLAVKAHYSGNFPNDLVGLHNFRGGYCGVSKVEKDKINICYLVDYETFKPYKNIEEFQLKVMCKNPKLRAIFDQSVLIFDKPITISQIAFEQKNAVENHILMIGDSAGLIHPLCGNGMAMAIHSAKIASDLVQSFLEHKISSRTELESKYTKEWNNNFKSRLAMGRLISRILQKEKLAALLMRLITLFPFVLPLIIKKTHGKPIL